MTPKTKLRGKVVKAYKVVCREAGQSALLSTSIGWTAASRLQYVPGKVTRPHKGWGPLAAFKTAKQAAAFIDGWLGKPYGSLHYEIHPCFAKPSRRKHLWSREAGRGKQIANFELPKGTILCDAIELLDT